MIESYVINFLMAALPGIAYGLILIFLIPFVVGVLVKALEKQYPQSIESEGAKTYKKHIDTALVVSRALGTIIIVLAIVVGFTSPTNTYKHEVHNKVQLNNAIEQKNIAPREIVIQDITRQPKLDDEARAERFNNLVDYTK